MDQIHASDLKALQESMQAVNTAQAVFNSFQAFIANKYGLGQNDSLDITTGKIAREPKPQAVPKAGAARKGRR